MQWSTACPDWERRIVAGQSLIPFDPLFPAEAEAAQKVFQELVIADMPGCPTMGQIARPWFLDFVSAIFGAYNPETGRRLIQESFLLISKKNMKSTGAAGIMMTALVRNWRESAEFLILAPTIEIADNSFHPARDMIRKDEELSDLLRVQEHTRTITHRKTHAELKVVAADSDTVGGKKATGVLVDELWIFGKKPKAAAMFREATGGLLSRPEGFIIYSSTQSDEPPAGVFKEKLQYARAVRDGQIEDPKFLPLLYEYPKSMLDAGLHRDRKYFYITNPNLGASVDEETLIRLQQQAEIEGEESQRTFDAKHLNIEVGLALRTDRWAGAKFWQAAARPGLTLDELIRRSDVITVGIDGGGLDDLLALVVMGRDKETQNWLAWGRARAHPVALERHKQEAARFHDFERDGDLVIVKSIGADIEELVEIVVRIDESGLLGGIGVDPAGIGDIVQAIEDAKVKKELISGISQGWRLVGIIKTSERRLADGSLLHGGQPLMAWCVSNAKVEPRGNAVLITKAVSGAGKIDPVMALFNAGSLMSLGPKPRTRKPQLFFLGG